MLIGAGAGLGPPPTPSGIPLAMPSPSVPERGPLAPTPTLPSGANKSDAASPGVKYLWLQSAPTQPAPHMHSPFMQSPLLLQKFGHSCTLTSHVSPVKPWLQSHLPDSVLHMPCGPQGGLHPPSGAAQVGPA
eukprot:CAMPEP_0115189460 /NCGR_PEP_ID=MMETSP0270-20121206/11527_1 /TAXON_ID=71861 /ORGANISM="Scrippsiella trochoidea, Strain CCMP3099" /LENGTH=131 /DNA_ID=CAMNT_0002602653 /DNA_START=1931 /DNA_END=2326 /DNA_ORIENTATION=-